MKTDKPYQEKIPIERKLDGTVSLRHYYDKNSDWANKNTDLVDNFIFEDTLHYVDYSTGRSSVLFKFRSDKGDSYGMFLSEFNKLLQDKKEVWNLEGKWTFVKRGANYGIQYIGI